MAGPGGAAVIGLAYFKDRRAAAEEVLDAVADVASARAGETASLRLLEALDDGSRRRILELNVEAFGREGETFDRRQLDEVAADPDALLVVLDVAGRLEGFFFGYYEEPGDPAVPGCDFFLDTGMVSAPLRPRRLGVPCTASILLLVALLGDVHRIGLEVWDRRLHALSLLYHRLGFSDTACRAPAHRCLATDVGELRVARWRALLGLPTPGAAGADGPPAA